MGHWEQGIGVRIRGLSMPLHRSRKDSIIAGVCGGIAEWIGWTPFRVRLLYVLISVLSAAFPGVVVYIVLWIVVPKAPEGRT